MREKCRSSCNASRLETLTRDRSVLIHNKVRMRNSECNKSQVQIVSLKTALEYAEPTALP